MKNKKIRFIVNMFMLILIICIFYSSFKIIKWYLDNQDNAKIQEELKENIQVVKTSDEYKDNSKSNEYKDNSISNEYIIDFKSLKDINKDTIGYLKVNNTNIDYVVVKGNDNSYYLKHNFKKENNQAGWIFMDYRNKLDGYDKNIIIYGHNTKDGSMFGTLAQVITKEWYSNKDNYIINLVLDGMIKKYQVFSTYSTVVEDYYITTNFKDNKEFKKFVDTLTNRSIYEYNVNVLETDHILTLSTCANNGSKRIVLHAKEI